MSGVVLASNQNSSLLNTLMASNAMRNPMEYSLKKIFPFHSRQTISHTPTSGTTYKEGTSTRFTLNKYGIIPKMVLEFKIKMALNDGTALTGTTTHVGMNKMGGLNSIKSIELLSSSRVIQTLSRESLFAAMSDKPSNYNSFERALNPLNGQTTVAITATGNAGIKADFEAGVSVFLPLLFPVLANPETYLNSEFLEPLAIQVNWNTLKYASGGTATATAVQAFNPQVSADPVLYVDYINFDSKVNDELLNSNYGQGTLSLLTYDYDSNESAGTNTLSNTAVKTIKTEIKNTSCVEAIYVFAEGTDDGASNLTGSNSHANIAEIHKPLELDHIRLYASGQKIVDIPAKLLECFGRHNTDGFWYDGGYNDETSDDGVNTLGRIYKIQLGTDNSNKFVSNSVSLRELNNVYVEADVSKCVANHNSSVLNGKTARLNVILKKSEILTIDSSNGRLVKSINN